MRFSSQHHLATTHLKLLLCAHSLWEVNKPATVPDQATILCHPGAGPLFPLPSPLHSAARSCHSHDSHFIKIKMSSPDPTTSLTASLPPYSPFLGSTGPIGPTCTVLSLEWSSQAVCGAHSLYSGYAQVFSLDGAFSDHPLENSTFQSLFSLNCFSSLQHLLALDILHNMFVCALSVSPSRRWARWLREPYFFHRYVLTT